MRLILVLHGVDALTSLSFAVAVAFAFQQSDRRTGTLAHASRARLARINQLAPCNLENAREVGKFDKCKRSILVIVLRRMGQKVRILLDLI